MLTLFSFSQQDGLTDVRDASGLRDLIADTSKITWIDMEKPTPEPEPQDKDPEGEKPAEPQAP
mgnify:CR=1 FL=1